VTAAAPLQRRLQPSATDTAFRVFISDVSRGIQYLVDRLTAGELTPDEWEQKMLNQLTAAHAQAGYRGRLRAGDHAPYDRDDTRFGYLVAQEEAGFLHGFRVDIESGRYGVDEPDTEAIARRASLYAQRIYGTANEALALVAGGDDVTWEWKTSPGETCPDCLRLEAHSPYRQLPTTPRAGDTICISNCKCSVQSSSGLETFAP
jgi:hypothetical protein